MKGRRTPLPALVSLCLAAALAGCGRTRAPEDTERLERVLRSGVEALTAGDYDGAARQFDAGLALSPGEPTFLTNKSIALRSRGVARYNASLELTDPAAVASEKEAARRDFAEAESLATEAAGRMKSASVWDSLRRADSYEANRRAAYAARAEVLRVLAARFDHARAGDALAAVRGALKRRPCPSAPCPAFGAVWLDAFELRRL